MLSAMPEALAPPYFRHRCHPPSDILLCSLTVHKLEFASQHGRLLMLCMTFEYFRKGFIAASVVIQAHFAQRACC
jgi:hypothetical protein